MNQFYVLKETNTFSDAIECIGLASIIDKVFQQVMPNDKPEIMIEDKGPYYKISVDETFTNAFINECDFFDFFPFIAKEKKNDKNELTYSYIDFDDELEFRKKFFKLSEHDQKRSERTPLKNFDVISIFADNANITAYQNSFNNLRSWKEYFPSLLDYMLKYYSSIIDRKEIEKELDDFKKKRRIVLKRINSLQDLNPDKGKGVNRKKADGVPLDSIKNIEWFRQLIRISGAFYSYSAVKIGKKQGGKKRDYKIYSIVPQSISLDILSTVYNSFKPFLRGNDSIKTDIMLILFTTKELILHHVKYVPQLEFFSPSDKVSGFQMAYYKNLGQRPAVTNIGFLGLPNFIKFRNKDEGKIWIEWIEEHQTIISKIDEGNSSNISMLLDYRQFISSSDFNLFFNFCYQYARLLMYSISRKQYFIKPFSLSSMEVFMQADSKFLQVLSNEGFKAIASAIRNSTIIPIIHNNKKDVVFGLSQKLKIASRDKTTLATEISAFIQKYNENIMLKDYHQKVHQAYVTTEQMQSFFALLDGGIYSSQLIAGMLVAYGYAKEPLQEEKDKN